MMASFLKRNMAKHINVALTSFVLLATLFAPFPVYAVDVCGEGKPQLRGDLNVLQANGGFWGYMEQSGIDLRDKSTLGFNLDGKFIRAVVIFEELCGNGTGKEVEAAVFKQVQEGIDRGRAIKRTESGNKPPEEIIGEIEQLNKDLDQIIKKYEH
ncbi:hypothetical protein UZ36_00565 [Candidatus Nitromaritima sp. SCGC AAA799-C22]|nr:hypothetical protein UZ36_00565 [Candidatus Nitromaritima sp. SCGC AAA799-C22]